MRVRHGALMTGVLLAAAAGICQTAAQPLGDVARAARQARKPDSKARVITNEDIQSGSLRPETPKPSQPSTSSSPSADAEDARSLAQYDVSGRMFMKRAAAQKAKIVSIQKRLVELNERLEKWNSEFWIYDYNTGGYVASTRASICGTGHEGSQQERDWCNTPQIVEDQTKLAKQNLASAQSELEMLQREIRSQGYGAKIYDPD